MVNKEFGITGIGNSIVDIIVQVEDDFLLENDLRKGMMSLVDLDGIQNLEKKFKIETTVSGGSVANSIVCMSQNGINSAFIGKVADDDLGSAFINGLNKENVKFGSSQFSDTEKTGRCIVMVSKDAQRTMSTYLGISQKLNENDINEDLIKQSNILYLEGYLWDLDDAQNAIKKSISVAKNNGTKIAFSVSDVFCIERFRESFIDIIKNDCDIIFANEDEMKALTQRDSFDEALDNIQSSNKIFAITQGDKGASILSDKKLIKIDPEEILKLVDTTGAGDLFAAGFLEYLILNKNISDCGQRGVQMASKVIQQYGARL
ncbi:adenosine kinase [Pelagibacteraceae bacterium]|nr:adenosine kinase [Pelagibacteraceae bacterium]